MRVIDGLLQELDVEAQSTRRLLERVPGGQLSWRPHPTARTLGELAVHVATVPGTVADLAAQPSPAQIPAFVDSPVPTGPAELVSMLDQAIVHVKRLFDGIDDTALTGTWRLMHGDRELVAVPRAAFLRSVMLNHWYHHRGQLSVYLRQLGVPIPSIYGPSGDENPFA